MATAKKISQLTAVVTPAGADVLAIKQSSTTKKISHTQLMDGTVPYAGNITQSQVSDITTVTQAAAELGTATANKLWTAQRVKQAIDSLAGTPTFALKTDGYLLVAGDRIIITAATAKTITVAATVAASDEFIVHNATSSAGVVSVEPNTGHTIVGPFGSAVGGTDTITLAPGETIRMVAVSASVLEII